MHKLIQYLGLAALCAAAALAEAPVQTRPGEQVASEDAVVRNFHPVDLGLAGLKLYRSASPVRDLVKGKDGSLANPATRVEAERILAHLKGRGIATIVSLEDPLEAGPSGGPSASVLLEQAAAKAAGVAFVSNPMRNANFKDMKPEAILAWLRAVEGNVKAAAGQGAVLVHCAAGHDRTGLVVAYLRITEDHWPTERAIAELRAYGHNWPKYSSNGGASSWHEEFLKQTYGGMAHAPLQALPPLPLH